MDPGEGPFSLEGFDRVPAKAQVMQILGALMLVAAMRVLLMFFPKLCLFAAEAGLVLVGVAAAKKSKSAALWGTAFLAFFTWTFFIPTSADKGRPSGRLTACSSNEKNIAIAIEMYGTDYAGSYPADLAELTPNYLKTIPLCPARDDDLSVPVGLLWPPEPPDYSYTLRDGGFTISCPGTRHRTAQIRLPNYPLYDSETGLTTSLEREQPSSPSD
jgi:hypothetical protein